MINPPRPRIDPALCIGCGACVEMCEKQVFALENGKAVVIDAGQCGGGGCCAEACPAHAIRLIRTVIPIPKHKRARHRPLGTRR